jgi:hypothetical protein
VSFGSKQFGLLKVGSDELRARPAAADSLERLTGDVTEVPDIFGVEVVEFVLYPVSPAILDRIKFGRIPAERVRSPCANLRTA